MMARIGLASLMLLGWAACGDSSADTPAPTPDASADADPVGDVAGDATPEAPTELFHQFSDWTLDPGEEIGSLCQSWVLDNEQTLYVNAVEFTNSGAYHHSNWFYVPEDHKDWPVEPWLNCYDEGFHEVDAALAGGVLFAQSTQVEHEVQRFNAGAAIAIPPGSRVIAVTHLLNYQPSEVTTSMSLRLELLPKDEVEVALTPFQLIYSPLDIPPNAMSSFEASCNIREAWEKVKPGKPFDMKLHYMLPHYHTLAAGFEIRMLGGPDDGEVLFDIGPFGSDPFGKVYDPPIDLSTGDGLTFKCTYDNWTDRAVHWGIGDQEMCEALGFIESQMAFTAGPSENVVQGEEGGVVVNTGECIVTGFNFVADK